MMSDQEWKKNLLRNFGFDLDLLVMALDSFKDVFPSYLEDIKSAIMKQDPFATFRAAHTLKGSLANFLHQEMVGLCQDLEKAAHAEDFAKAENLFRQIKSKEKGLIDQIQKLIMETPAHQNSPDERTGIPGTILIVEDDHFTAHLLMERLGSQGYRTLTTDSPDQILKLIKAEKVDLVLLDLILGQKSGKTALRDIRREHRPIDLPVLVLTAVEDTQDVTECLALGANDYITKPFLLEVVNARIQTHLSLCHLYRQELELKELETLNSMILTYNHELNSPLTAALGFLARAIGTSPESVDLAKTQNALQKISQIVTQITELSKIAKDNNDPLGTKIYKIS